MTMLNEKNYDFVKIEKEMQDLWEKEQIYRFDPCAPGEIYSIDTPPPTVSGSLHIGHIFSYTQAEMIARFRRMKGQNVFYPFGFDDNGLPTERLVERDEGIRAKDMPRSEFIEKCIATTGKYEAGFKQLWKSMGFSVDWSLQYETISPDVREISQARFLELVRMGKAYTKDSPVLWCTECRTSIAQAELETKEIDSAFNYITFKTADGDLEVATTRPELLYGCVCLFVNPEDPRYEKYIGKTATVPLYGYDIPIYADDKVGVDKGTGVVMCATFGDSTDMEWYATHGLPYRRVILPDGTVAEDDPFIGGLTVKEARKEIIRLLDAGGMLIRSEKITHTVATHERCGREIEIIPSRQWYIDVMTERERFMRAADEIDWYPQHMKTRYVSWVENLKWDWCISRQRYFGVPFPVWYCHDCGKPAYASPELLPVNPLETAYEGRCECGCVKFDPESAVLDTWATSSLTPQINERFGYGLLPMSMRTHAHEIIRTWTFYTIVRSLYHTGRIPWKELMINGFVLSEKGGGKISKSKSNSDLQPMNLIGTYSADALRYWAASAKLGTDTYFSADELAVSKRFMTKLWNACRFAISHLQDIDLTRSSELLLLPVDRWIRERAADAINKATELLYSYEVGSARHEIDDFFWKDLCDNYIEIVKDRLYRPDIHGEEARRSGQLALYMTLLDILKLYAIFVPHITDHIYIEFFKKYENVSSIHLLKWEEPRTPDPELLRFGEMLKAALSDVRRYKSENNLSMRAEIEFVEIRAEPEMLALFKETEGDLKACANTTEIRHVNICN